MINAKDRMKPVKRATIMVFLYAGCGFLIHPAIGYSQESADRIKPAKPYSIGFLPYGRYSDDKGFGFGIVFQWDDKRSPEYQPYFMSHRVSIEYTTRGIQDYSYKLDSKYLLPADLRLTAEVRYMVSLFEPYHGFGGAQTIFSEDYIDSTSSLYRGRYYYMYDKRYVQLSALVQGQLKGQELRWLAGLVSLSTRVDTIDYSKYPATSGQSLLRYHWELHGADTEGGLENGLMAGLVWDRRDHETSPRQGLWSEILLRWVPRIPGNDFAYAALTATHRQYLLLLEDLTFALRFSGRLMTEGAPFFAVPRLDGSFSLTEAGLGGNKTIRGVLWQRASGRNFFYSNLELRYRAFHLLRTGYFAASTFYDFGRTFDEAPPANMKDRGEETDCWHRGVGFGLRLAPSDTFILALDLGWPLDPALDGPGVKIYMGLDWLF